jgi:hypothetical protein
LVGKAKDISILKGESAVLAVYDRAILYRVNIKALGCRQTRHLVAYIFVQISLKIDILKQYPCICKVSEYFEEIHQRKRGQWISFIQSTLEMSYNLCFKGIGQRVLARHCRLLKH